MSAFAMLGVPSGAHEAQIKRAHAKPLRSTRQDDDPVAFQRLNEAYAQCLDQAR